MRTILYYKWWFVLFVFLNIPGQSSAQTGSLDFESYKTWPVIIPHEISNNGKFISYSISSPSTQDTLYVEATDGSYIKRYTGVSKSCFTQDSRRIIFTTAGDSMGILDLEFDSLRYFGGVTDFKTPENGNGRWITFLQKGNTSALIALDLTSGNKKIIEHVRDYQITKDGTAIWAIIEKKENKVDSKKLIWFDLNSGKTSVISHGCQYSEMVFDNSGAGLCFLANESAGTTLCYYSKGMDSGVNLLNNSFLNKAGINLSKRVPLSFNRDGNKIFFGTEKQVAEDTSKPSREIHLHIFNYNKDFLDFQNEARYGPKRCVTDIHVPGNWIQLQKPGDVFLLQSSFGRNDYMIFQKKQIKNANLFGLYLVSVKDGSRHLIRKASGFAGVRTSVTGKYIIWFDPGIQQWICYNVITKKSKIISDKIQTPLSMPSTIPNIPFGSCYDMAGWMKGESSVILQDRYDIWQVDPEAVRPPVNLTKGYGKQNHTELRFLNFNEREPEAVGDTMFLSAFEERTKRNGFFRLALSGSGQSKLDSLVMEPRMYYYGNSPKESTGAFNPFFPVKAKCASAFMLERMSATEYPNLYVSNDLSIFFPVTSLEPQKQYNWYTTELYRWELPNHKWADGILYKPQNFNAANKYPVIFFYYETYSDALNNYIHPALSNGVMNIPWFVSNGYLVFVPDIYYEVGFPGQSAYNSVVSAAKFLSKKPFADSHHMGLQGHSFGGFETNYIVSRTSIFAAAAPSAGEVELISAYGQNINYYESGQGRIGVSFWKRPDLYIQNSSFFRADHVTTPLLIMHNDHDASVSFRQGLEWFNGLARLRKKVWMLDYDGEDHTIQKEENQLDYSIRLAQFFDHYLKGTSAPEWMTRGSTDLDLDIKNKK